jgi:hypothetical protein
MHQEAPDKAYTIFRTVRRKEKGPLQTFHPVALLHNLLFIEAGDHCSVLLHFNFLGDDFPAASFGAIPIGVTLNSHTAKDSHDLSCCGKGEMERGTA